MGLEDMRSPEAHSCPYLDDCPIFRRLGTQGSRDDWIHRYCRGEEPEACERFRGKRSGLPVPVDLLPDGSTIED